VEASPRIRCSANGDLESVTGFPIVSVTPGQTGCNLFPPSNPPTNFVWMRYARLEFHKGTAGPVSLTPQEVNVHVLRHDPAMDTIVGPNPKIFKLAEGFQFTEGPVWVPQGGYLLFSDPNSVRCHNCCRRQQKRADRISFSQFGGLASYF